MSLLFHRRLVAVTLLLVAFITVLLIVGWLLAQGRPGWWKLVNAQDAGVRLMAENVENGLTTLLNQHRATSAVPPLTSRAATANQPASDSAVAPQSPPSAGVDWKMTLDQGAASAWLAARLPAWVEHELGAGKWPRVVRQVQARFDDDRIEVAAEVGSADSPRIVTLRLRPWVDDKGAVWIDVTSASLGLLPVPVSAAMSSITANGHAGTQELLDILSGKRAALPRGEISLPDGRHVRLRGAKAADGVLTIECRTEPRRP